MHPLFAVNDATSQRIGADLLAGLKRGQVASTTGGRFAAHPVDDGTAIEIDLGDPDTVYLVTVAAVPRVV